MSDTGLDIVAKAALENQDNIIYYSPISVDATITHVTNQPSVFGYEIEASQTVVPTKVIIITKPESSFLRANGVFYESGGDLPIICFIPFKINAQKLDLVTVSSRDDDTVYTDVFQIVDVKIHRGGIIQTHNKFYLLAPYRQ